MEETTSGEAAVTPPAVSESSRTTIVAILISVFLMGAGQPLLALFRPAGFEIFGATSILISFCLIPVALANDQFEPHEMVRAAGAIVMYYGIGNVFGPVLGSQFMRWVGPAGLFLSMTLVLVLFLVFVLVRRVLIPALPKRPSGYRVYPRTSASAFQMLRKARVRREPAPRDAGDSVPSSEACAR